MFLDEAFKYAISVDQILIAKKRLDQTKTENDKNYLEHICENLNKQIDKIVYHLYGYSEDY
jgi:hypothetical protein